VIKSFAEQTTHDLYDGLNTKAARKIDRQIWPVVARKLDMLNAAVGQNDLKSPGNHLEKLKGDLAGFWSIRVNDRYRIIFAYQDGNATQVRCQDHP
jgi:proteic killer suppression protein